MKKQFKYILLTFIAIFALFTLGACGVKDKLDQLKCEKHDFGAVATSIEKEATCTEKGKEFWTCSLCGYEDVRDIPLLEHTYDGGVQTKAPTCKVVGEMTYSCIECGAKRVENIEKLPHERVDVEMVSPTCTTSGYTAYAYCADCNSVIVAKQTLPALGHSPSIIVGIAATCTEPGLKSGSSCSVCGELIKAQQTIPARGHTIVVDKAIMAECDKSGLTAGSHCSSCDLVIQAQEVVPALEHDYGNGTVCNICGEHRHEYVQTEAVAPTCTTAGKTSSTYCSACLKVIAPADVIPAKGHTMENGICLDCGIEHEHIVVEDSLIPATCYSTGLSKGTHCSDCGKIIMPQVVLPMKSHNEVIVSAVPPTCTMTGLSGGSYCSVCDTILIKQQVIPVQPHTVVVQPAITPTCTTMGKTEGSHCADCGLVLVAQQDIPKAHKYNDDKKCILCDYEYVTEGFEFVERTVNGVSGYSLMGIGEATDTELYIPSMYKGKPVVAIDTYAFDKYNKSVIVTKLVVRNGSVPLEIGGCAFRNQQQLKTVIFERSISFLDTSTSQVNSLAFYFCNGIEKLILKDTVTSIESGASDSNSPSLFYCGHFDVYVEGDLPEISSDLFWGWGTSSGAPIAEDLADMIIYVKEIPSLLGDVNGWFPYIPNMVLMS